MPAFRFPIHVDSAWNEFDLGQVYREIAPRLCEEDSEFRVEYEEMLERVRVSKGAPTAAVHRKWLPCDSRIVNAWIQGRFPYAGESWIQFRERVLSCRLRICNGQARENILVVTSATPIAVWTGLSLEICDDRLMRLAGALYNASYTVLRVRPELLRLFTFNAASYLTAPGLHTHR